MFSLARLPLPFASGVVLLQPVMAAFYALMVFTEKLSALEMAGMLVALLGICIAKGGNTDALNEAGTRIENKPTVN